MSRQGFFVDSLVSQLQNACRRVVGLKLVRRSKFEALKVQRSEFEALKVQRSEFEALKAELDAANIELQHSRSISSPDDQDNFLELARLLEPVGVKNAVKVRIGRPGDGGYVMLDQFKDIDAAFSFGIEREISWDTDMASRGCAIYMYDHSVDGPPVESTAFHFFKKMIGAKQDTVSGVESIESVMHANGAPSRRNILKIDIEGSEWSAFDAASESTLDRFSQIVCEFHDFHLAIDPVWRERALRVLRKLNKYFAVVHVHGNNYAPFHVMFNIPFPRVVEVSFVNRCGLETAICTESFPTPLDYPNYADRSEIILGSFRFPAKQNRD